MDKISATREKWKVIFTPLAPIILDADETTIEAYHTLMEYAVVQIKEAEYQLPVMRELENLPAMCGVE